MPHTWQLLAPDPTSSPIRRAAAGGLAFDIRPTAPSARLSERELAVVRLVVDGLSNDEVGTRLGIGANTVGSHLGRLFERFAVASRTEPATRALREGWLEVPPPGQGRSRSGEPT